MRASDTHRTSTGSSFVTLSLGAPTRTLSRDASKPPKTSVDPTTSPRSSGPARDDDAAASTRRTHSLVAPSLSTMRDSGRVRQVCADAETDARNGRVLPPSERPERSDLDVDGGSSPLGRGESRWPRVLGCSSPARVDVDGARLTTSSSRTPSSNVAAAPGSIPPPRQGWPDSVPPAVSFSKRVPSGVRFPSRTFPPRGWRRRAPGPPRATLAPDAPDAPSRRPPRVNRGRAGR